MQSKLTSSVLFLIVLAMLGMSAHAQEYQWRSTGGPGQARIRSMYIDTEGRLFSMTGDGIERSIDGGRKWERFRLTGTGFTRIGVSPGQILFAAGVRNRREEDGSIRPVMYVQAWELQGEGVAWNGNRIEVDDPGPLSNIVTGMDGSGYIGMGNAVWYYIGWGNGWSQHVLPAGRVNALMWQNEDEVLAGTTDGLFAFGPPYLDTYRSAGLEGKAILSLLQLRSGTVLAGSEDGLVYARTLSQTAWDTLAGGLSAVHSLGETQSGDMLAGTKDRGLLRSMDGGTTWTSSGFEEVVLEIHGSRTDTLYLVTDVGVLYSSVDEGGHWERIEWVESDIDHLVATPDGKILAAEGTSAAPTGLQEYSPETGTWRALGFVNGSVERVAVAPDGTYFVWHSVITSAGSVWTLYRSTDRGATWEPRSSGPNEVNTDLHPVNADILFKSDEDKNVSRSTDGGRSWIPLPDVPPYLSAFFIDKDADLYGAQFLGEGLHISRDLGDRWRQIRIQDGFRGSIAQMIRSEGGALLASVFGPPVIYRSINGGSTWHAGNMPDSLSPDNDRVWQFFQKQSGELFAAYYDVLLHSNDDGASWQVAAGYVDAGQSGGFSFGSRMERVNAKANLFNSYPLAMDTEGTLYASTVRGVYRLERVESATVVESSFDGADHTLELMIFPNPNQGEIHLTFQLDQSAHVRATLYDLTGRERMGLTDESLPAGNHTLHRVLNVPSGVYLVLIQADDIRASRMIHVRRTR